MDKLVQVNGKTYKEDDVLELGINAISNLFKIRTAQEEAQSNYEGFESRFEDDSYEEAFEDTLERKYEEGFADALAFALQLLEGEAK